MHRAPPDVKLPTLNIKLMARQPLADINRHQIAVI